MEKDRQIKYCLREMRRHEEYIKNELICKYGHEIVELAEKKLNRQRRYTDILVRATVLGLMNRDEATDRMMDIESADLKFNLRLDDWFASDDFNFAHDFAGIVNNIVRKRFPSEDFGHFVPRFAGIR